MDKNDKIKEKVPINLDVQIKDKLTNVLNDFEDLCSTLGKLGITLQKDFKPSNSNALFKGCEISDSKTKVRDDAPGLLQVSGIICSSSITYSQTLGINTIGSEVVRSSREAIKTTSSTVNCYEYGSDSSASDTDASEFSYCSSEALSTAVNLSNRDSIESLSSEEISKSDSEVNSTTMTLPKKYRTRLRSVDNYSDGHFVECFSETSSKTIKSGDQDTDLSTTSATADQALGGLLFDILTSNPQKAYDGFSPHHTQDTSEALKSPNGDSKSYTSDLEFSDSNQGELINKLCNNIYMSLGIDQKAAIVKKKSSHSELQLDNDKVTFANADETWENEMSGTDKESDLKSWICDGVKAAIYGEDFSEDSNRMQRESSRCLNEEASPVVSEKSLQNNPFENERRFSVSSDDSTDNQPDRLDNIFKIIVKCHPMKNFEIPPYANANPETTLDIKDSWTKYTENEMPVHDMDENQNISEEFFYDIDSHSVMVFEYADCFSQNSSLVCDALIMDYLKIAVSSNIFLIKKTKDVSIEDCDSHLSTLRCLDDELGYLSAKLIIARNDWMKQFCEIDQNLRENEQWRISSRGFYYMGMVRVCLTLTEILLKYCLENQLELEEYERNLMLYHKCSN